MLRRPPRSTRTDTLFPYTTLFRSCANILLLRASASPREPFKRLPNGLRRTRGAASSHRQPRPSQMTDLIPVRRALLSVSDKAGLAELAAAPVRHGVELVRSEERRVGKEGVRTCRYRWWP